jgi:hypothetical protein
VLLLVVMYPIAATTMIATTATMIWLAAVAVSFLVSEN